MLSRAAIEAKQAERQRRLEEQNQNNPYHHIVGERLILKSGLLIKKKVRISHSIFLFLWTIFNFTKYKFYYSIFAFITHFKDFLLHLLYFYCLRVYLIVVGSSCWQRDLIFIMLMRQQKNIKARSQCVKNCELKGKISELFSFIRYFFSFFKILVSL